ncbi:MAG: hypothetical protein A2Y80_00490 [Deltaproteobacteria bacterium RBG_13_58_19]|nr:MAG: hypothetical protein A2Y80_00490 [Deltaproteobacteria bacterium RBG_13_58_19]
MKKNVAFICWGNSCRSIMAEALARHFLGASLTASSAGISPLGFVSRETIQVLTEMGVATQGLHSKGLGEIDLQDCHLLVNLTDYSLEPLLPVPFPGLLIHRPVHDPYGRGLESYRESRDDIIRLVNQEICRWLG